MEYKEIELFSEHDKNSAKRTKKVLFFSWLFMLISYLAVFISFASITAYKVSVFRDRSDKVWMLCVLIPLTILFVCYSLFFFSIKYRLTRKYVRMLRDMDAGLKDVATATFIEYDNNITMKDGVYFYTMVVEARPLKREDITERRVLVEQTIEKPRLGFGQKMKITTHANILMSYILMGDYIEPDEDYYNAIDNFDEDDNDDENIEEIDVYESDSDGNR